ncbi:MAG: hypothetical protein Q8S08_12960 [Halomonas sp.]|nr:hypothetical protein [Halomonas sp.]MDP3536288.1 hypothetical protein [Halomonas sp.]
MRPEASITITSPAVDPYSKQMRSNPYAQFCVQELGILEIEGYDVRSALPVRLPLKVEPGDSFALCMAGEGVVVAVACDHQMTTLLETPRVVVTEWLTVQCIV